MELVGAGFGGNVQVAAGAAAGFAVAGGLQRVLVERVDGVDDAGDAADAALVYGVHLQVKIIVVRAVDGVVDLVAARAVDGAGVVIAGKGCRGAEKLREVAAIERHVLQRLGIKRRSLCDGGGVEREGVRGNLDGGGLLRDAQLNRQRVDLSGQYLYARNFRGLEAGGLHLDGVVIERKVVERKLACAGRNRLAHRCSCCIRGCYLGGGNHRSGGVGDGAVDGAAKGLRRQWGGKQQKQRSQDGKCLWPTFLRLHKVLQRKQGT
jgi:hypothetical protein